MSKFVHLHTHSHYSLLDGLGKISELVSRAKELGMQALALTDHGVMYGVIEFYETCLKEGIKPIIGLEAYIAQRKMTDKQPKIDANPYHLVLLAKNDVGYHNLLKLTTDAHLEGYYYKPRIDKEYLKKNADGLIALTACLGGEIPTRAAAGNTKAAETALLEYLAIFGRENFYLELQDHPQIPEQKRVNEVLIELAKKHQVGLVATNDVHYINKDDAEAQDVMLCIQTGKLLSDTDRLAMTGNGEYIDISFRSGEEMTELFKNLPEAISNTAKIAEQCNVQIELGKFKFPPFDLPKNETDESYLKKLIDERLPQVVDKITPEIRQRIDYEFKVIKDKNYLGYFLIVQDFFHWAKENNIPTNTRGSAAGCFISYVLGITSPKLNPIDFNLPFERFLNPFRPSAPDIDIDIADSGRDQIINYVTEKYGQNRVAQICTFGTMASKAAIRDVARVLGFPYEFGDTLSKLIPFSTQTHYISISDSLKIVRELKDRYNNDPDAKRTIDLAIRLEGCVRHASVHAAGVVIAPDDLWKFTPLMRDTRGDRLVTQYEMHAVGEDGVGLIKMDFLGLANLTIIQNVLKIIRKTKHVDLKLEEIPLDDKETFGLLARGQTVGVFQLESEGMRKHIKELKPTTIFDIMAMVALYRPGPMAFIPEYIARKQDPTKIKYADPRLAKILDKSLGLIVYQDDVLMIAIELAGYNWQEVDKFRKAIGKKIVKEMAAQKEKFFSQIIERGMKPRVAQDLWDQIETFAGYGFNKAHAASYGLVAYQTAYLKTHFPSEYMAAWLTSEEQRDIDKVAFALQEAARMKIPVLPPDINKSFVDFGVIPETAAISYALSSIKNVGRGTAMEIIEERKRGGDFKNFEDFLLRLGGRVLNKKIIEALTKAGALDAFGERNEILASMENILKFTSTCGKEDNSSQMGLFGTLDIKTASLKLVKIESASKKQKLSWEKEFLGMYVSEHPLKDMEEILQSFANPIGELSVTSAGSKVKVAGIISSITKINTRSNEPMLFVTVEDTSDKMEVLVFPKVLKKDSLVWHVDNIVLVNGRTNTKDGVLKIVAEDARELAVQQTLDKKEPKLTITLPPGAGKDLLLEIKKILIGFPGQFPVYLKIPNNGDLKEVRTKTKINGEKSLLEKLTEMVGQKNLQFDK